MAIYTQRLPDGLTRKPPRGTSPAPCQDLPGTWPERVLHLATPLTWTWTALDLASTCPTPPGPPEGVWHRASHPGATIQMKLRPRRTLKWDATLDVIGRTHHTMAGMVLTRTAVAIYTQRPPNGLTRKPPRGS